MKLTLVSKTPITTDVTSFSFKPETPVTWKAGQYFHYILNHENPDNRGTERWFTISSAPFENTITVTTRLNKERSSSFKTALNQMQIGDQIEGDGPEGDFTLDDLSKKYIFIAGGIGITPFRSMFAQLTHDNLQLNCDLLYANRDEEYVFEDEINQFATTQANFRMHKFSNGNRVSEKDINEVSPDLNSSIYYISGPKPMVEFYNDILTNMGVTSENIKLDDFPGYEVI